MSLFERYLTIWVALCIVAGVALATLPIVARRRRYIKIVRPEAKEHSC